MQLADERGRAGRQGRLAGGWRACRKFSLQAGVTYLIRR